MLKVVPLPTLDPSPYLTVLHPKDAEVRATVSVSGDGGLVLRIEGPDGHHQMEDAEGPVEGRLARALMALEGRGFFTEADHHEGITALFGVNLDDLSSDGARTAAKVALHLMAPALAP